MSPALASCRRELGAAFFAALISLSLSQTRPALARADVHATTACQNEGTADPHEQLIEAVVATVNQAVITQGQVEAEARVVLLRRGGLAGLRSPIDDGLRAAVLQYMINQQVILSEAHRLKLFQVPQRDLDQRLGALRSLFANSQTYQRFLDDNGLIENDLRQILRRDLRVQKFLASRVKMLSEISPDELRAYFALHRQDYAGQSFEQARASISALLGRQRSATAIASWVDELRAQAHIRILRPYAKTPGQTSGQTP